MKTVPVESKGLTLEKLLPEIGDEGAVFLTVGGEVRFVVMSADEGDQEVLAMRGNKKLMAFLDRCGERARTSPRKSLQDLRAEEATRRRRTRSARAKEKNPRRPPGKKQR
jgi:hypothetical protein